MCGGTPFLLMVSAGLDAHAVRHADPVLKRRFGRIGLGITGLSQWWSYQFPPIALTVDGEPIAPATFAAVCNIPHYGGPFAMAPAARWDDGLLDLVVQRGGGRWSSLAFDLDVVRGRHLRRADVAVYTAREVLLDGPRGLCLQVDGDVCVEALPATVRLAAERLPVLVPGGS
jgi:diacylglycerol kinase family enzyme